MFTALLQRMKKDDKGFTLIELLVVILIIGILAAIALPTFLGQKDKAKDASAKSNARNAVTQVESCLTTSQAPTTCGTANDEVKGAVGDGGVVTVTDANTYTVTAKSDTKNTFTITKTGTPGAFARTCSISGGSKNGGCASEGASW